MMFHVELLDVTRETMINGKLVHRILDVTRVHTQVSPSALLLCLIVFAPQYLRIFMYV
jgi:hypothetical protein